MSYIFYKRLRRKAVILLAAPVAVSESGLNGQLSLSCGAAVHALFDDSFKWSRGHVSLSS